MTTTDDGTALLKAVIANPAEDTPRLVYADWLDENDHPERAEFIRVQVAIATVKARHRRDCVGTITGLIKLRPLCDREAKLFDSGRVILPADQSDPLYPLWDWGRHTFEDGYRALTTPLYPLWDWGRHTFEDGYRALTTASRPGNHIFIRRGFVEAVTCTAADWVRYADALLVAHPVREVTLTTWPEPLIFDRGLRIFHFEGRRQHCFRDIEGLYTRYELVERLLEAEWPKISFRLPDLVTTE